MARFRRTYPVDIAFQAATITAGQRFKLPFDRLPTRGPKGGLLVLDRLRIKTPTIEQTIPAGKSLDAFSLGQLLQIGIILAAASPFSSGECGRELIPEGTWMCDLMRVLSLVTGKKFVRGGNGRLRVPQIAGADVVTALDPYVAVKEQDDRACFPQHSASFGGDGGGGGAAFSTRVEFTVSLQRRGESPKRGIPLAHLNGDFSDSGKGQSAGYLSIGIPPTLKMDNTAFTISTEGFEVLADCWELNPDEVPVPVMPRVIVDLYNSKTFTLSKPGLPKDLIVDCPEVASGAQSVNTMATVYVQHDGADIGDPSGDMTRLPNAIADQLEQLDERWAYPVSTDAMTSTVGAARLLRDMHILATAVDRGMADLIPPGRININAQSATIPTGGFRIIQVAWDPGDFKAQADSASKLGGDPRTLEPQTKNGNPAGADKGVNLPKMAKAVADALTK